MATRPPPSLKGEEKHRRDILKQIEKGWEWATDILKTVHNILLRNLFETKISHITSQEPTEQQMETNGFAWKKSGNPSLIGQ